MITNYILKLVMSKNNELLFTENKDNGNYFALFF